MASPLYQSIEALSREKGIEPEIVVSAIEDAIALATRKYYKTTENMRAEMDKDTGEIRAYVFKTVVETPELVLDESNELTLDAARELAPEVEVGGELRFYKDTSPLGRIAAQMAKQVIFQKVREAERDTVFNEYNHRAGEVLNATVKRLEPMDVIFDLGKAEARMPKREQSRLEQFAVGERVRVVLLRVDRAAKGPQVIVSRAAPALVQNLFQSEVPEIYDGTVTHPRHCPRSRRAHQDRRDEPRQGCRPGRRVRGHEGHARAVDHPRTARRKDRHHRIFGGDHHLRRKGAAAGQGSRVSITDLDDKQIEVIVDDTQLSLAIGKKGQNVRLAAKLLNWKIDIKSEEEKRQEVEQQMQAMSGGPTTPIEQVTELGESILEKLIAAGITTVEEVADMTAEELAEVPGIGEKSVEKIASPSATTSASTRKAKRGPSPMSVIETPTDTPETTSMAKTPEEILAEAAALGEPPVNVDDLSTEDLAAAEDDESASDANDDADRREEGIEMDNDTIDTWLQTSQEVSDETIDSDGHDRG